MPPRVPRWVIGAGWPAMAAGRDPRDPPLRPGGGPARIAVIASARHPAHGLYTVCSSPRGQSQPDGPARPRPDASGHAAPLGARQRRMAALRAGGLGRDPDRAGFDPPRRAVRCVPHCRPPGGPHAPLAPTAEAARGMLPGAGVGGPVMPRYLGAQNPKPGMPKPVVVRGGATHRARTARPMGFPTLCH